MKSNIGINRKNKIITASIIVGTVVITTLAINVYLRHNVNSKLNDKLAIKDVSNTTLSHTEDADNSFMVDEVMEPVEIQKVNIQTDNTNKSWARNGSNVKVYMKFSDELTVRPTVKIAGQNAVVIDSDLSEYDYIAQYHIADSEKSLSEGNIGFEVSNYSGNNGIVGETVNTTTDGSTVTYDRTKPIIANVNYNEEAGVAKNEEWRRKQKATITATDNLTTNSSEIKFEYEWVKEGEYSTNLTLGINGEEISKSGGTGKYSVYCKVTDLAGNEVHMITDPFYLDNSITKCGGVKVTYNTENGKEYKFIELTDDMGNKYYEGGYITGNNLYIMKQDGEDNESGHKETIYEIYRLNNYGTSEETEIVVGYGTVQDTQILNDGDYKIVVTTKDNALTKDSVQLPNIETKTYILHKGRPNIEFSPNGVQEHTVNVSTRAKIKDTVNSYKSASYAWAKEGEEPTTYKNLSIQSLMNGTTIDFDSDIKDNAKYNLYIKTIDTNENTNITKSESFYVANKVENPGTIGFKLNDESGKEYLEKTYTNKNVFVYIKDQGKDDFGGIIQNTYSIQKDSKTIVGDNTTESTVLKDSGKYTISLKTTNSIGAIKYQNYEVWIDKDKPVVSFTGVGEITESITVEIEDDGICKSEINIDTLKYYWTRSDKTPSLQDFEGTTENGLRGKIADTNSSIRIPSNVSGKWHLWVYAEDNVGNSTLETVEMNFNIDNEPPIAGMLKLTYQDESGEWKEYTTVAKKDENGKIVNEGIFTKHAIRIDLINGYDADSGIKSNTYSITRRNDNKSLATNETDWCTIIASGIYDVKIETTDNRNNKSSREYILKIDKNAPNITFNPNRNNTYAKRHDMTVSVTEPETEAGVKESNTKYVWIGCNPEITEISNREQLLQKLREIQQNIGEASEGDYIRELNKNGIDYIETSIDSESKISTPSEKSGAYYLYVKAEDNLGNKITKMSDSFNIDNIIPTTPNIRATKSQMIGTSLQDVNYYGEKTNQDITVIAENSTSLSGVDKYEYTYITEGGEWTDWKDGTQISTKNGNKIGVAKITEHGRTVVKFRSISELEDGTLLSQETEEFTVVIDKKGPKVTFANCDDGGNGQTQGIQNIKVRVTITDENGINENTLKYKWAKFDTIEDYNELSNKQQDELEYLVEEGTIFKSGEEIPSPVSTSGIYAIIISAEDSFGNKTITYSNYYLLITDKTAPKITFANYDNGQNGCEQSVESIKVRITATDESGINENTLRYSWVKFDTVEKYKELSNKNQQELSEIMGEGMIFKNGEEIPSPGSASGIYAILTSAEDIYKNKVISYSNYYVLNLENDHKVDYQISNEFITKVLPETTSKDFLTNIKKVITGTKYEIFDSKGNKIANEANVTTDSVLKIDNNKQYKIVVIGDVNGDGKMNGLDLARVRLYLVGKLSLNNTFEKAIDINNDSRQNGIDLSKMRLILVGLSKF